MLIKQKMFIFSALCQRGPFHAAKVRILIIMCNDLTKNSFYSPSAGDSFINRPAGGKFIKLLI
jgi:hypothetical protein